VPYRLFHTPKAHKQLNKLPDILRMRIRKAEQRLKEDPRAAGLKLTDEKAGECALATFA